MNTRFRHMRDPILPENYASRISRFSSNLVAYWPMNETAGGTITDTSGNGYNGSYNGVTINQVLGAGITMGNAGTWDGINDNGNLYSASFASRTDYRDTGSLVVWFKGNTQGKTLLRLSNNVATPNLFTLSLMRENFGGQVIRVHGSGGNSFALTFASFSTTDWNFMAARWVVGTPIELWAAGAINAGIGNTASAGLTALDSGHCKIGSAAASSFYAGNVAHLALFNSALTDADFTFLSSAK